MLKFQKIIYFILINICSYSLHSQILNSKYNYTFVEQDLKEFLAIQALLSENRMDELIEFLENNSYKYSDKDNLGIRYLKNRIIVNEVTPMVIIQSGKDEEGVFLDNSLLISFGFTNAIDPLDVQWAVDKFDIEKLEIAIKSTFEIGYNYNVFDAIESDENVKVEKIDRYTKKIISKDDPEFTQIIKASNFYIFEKWPNIINFAGPGKTSGTAIEFKTINSPQNDNSIFPFLTIKSLRSTSLSSDKQFNLDFFMNIKKLNDRIWFDR